VLGPTRPARVGLGPSSFGCPPPFESARGLAHSRTLARGSWTQRVCILQAPLGPRLGRSTAAHQAAHRLAPRLLLGAKVESRRDLPISRP